MMSPAVILSPDVQRFVLDQRLGFVATVRPDGTPNVSPKGTTTVWDDEHLMFADVASPQTIENLRTNPHIEINVVDPVIRKGYRFRGTAEVHQHGPDYEHGIALLQAQGSKSGPDRIRSIVVVTVTEVRTLISPAYDDGSSEADIGRRWLSHLTDLHRDKT
jgi:predicted pyridoxine 5'-phosphate oxidase superfamily flavin-nucleotide-binding protein